MGLLVLPRHQEILSSQGIYCDAACLGAVLQHDDMLAVLWIGPAVFLDGSTFWRPTFGLLNELALFFGQNLSPCVIYNFI